MKTKPWSLIILALLHVFAPIGNLLLNSLRFNRSLEQQWQYWFEVLPKYILIIYIFIPILAGIFIYLCRRWTYWAYIACVAVLFLTNIYAYWTNMHWGTFIGLILILAVDLVVVAYFFVPSVQSVYMDPRMRWWEAAPRYNFNHEGLVNGQKAFVKNLSQGGLFMTSGPSLEDGQRVECTWNFDGVDCKISGLVIYKISRPEMTGYGVRFEHNHDSQKQLKTVIEKLHAQGLILSERLPGPEDSFGVWFKKLLTSGEGLFPKIKR